VAVVSESDSAPQCLKNGSGEDADSPSRYIGPAAFGPDRYKPAGGFEIVTEL